MTKPNDIKENFSALLRDSLRSRYGRIPSAAVVAREFNLRAYETSPITQESARRWLRGVSLPEEERLRVLVNWLNLDFNRALQMKGRVCLERNGNSIQNYEPNDSKFPTNNAAGANGKSSKHKGESYALSSEHNGLDKETHELLEAMMQMNRAQKMALLDLVRLGFRNTQPEGQ